MCLIVSLDARTVAYSYLEAGWACKSLWTHTAIIVFWRSSAAPVDDFTAFLSAMFACGSTMFLRLAVQTS